MANITVTITDTPEGVSKEGVPFVTVQKGTLDRIDYALTDANGQATLSDQGYVMPLVEDGGVGYSSVPGDLA